MNFKGGTIKMCDSYINIENKFCEHLIRSNIRKVVNDSRMNRFTKKGKKYRNSLE